MIIKFDKIEEVGYAEAQEAVSHKKSIRILGTLAESGLRSGRGAVGGSSH